MTSKFRQNEVPTAAAAQSPLVNGRPPTKQPDQTATKRTPSIDPPDSLVHGLSAGFNQEEEQKADDGGRPPTHEPTAMAPPPEHTGPPADGTVVAFTDGNADWVMFVGGLRAGGFEGVTIIVTITVTQHRCSACPTLSSADTAVIAGTIFCPLVTSLTPRSTLLPCMISLLHLCW